MERCSFGGGFVLGRLLVLLGFIDSLFIILIYYVQWCLLDDLSPSTSLLHA